MQSSTLLALTLGALSGGSAPPVCAHETQDTCPKDAVDSSSLLSLVQAKQKLGTFSAGLREGELHEVGLPRHRSRVRFAQEAQSGRGHHDARGEGHHDAGLVGLPDAKVSMRASQATAKVMNSMVRITSTSPETKSGDLLFKPWDVVAGTAQSVGSGLIVKRQPLIMATNAHVVSDALAVEVTLPNLGRERFDAQVHMISHDFDVALLTLTPESEAKLQYSAVRAGFHVGALQLAERSPACPLGVSVLAVGFSLGSETPKLSEGVISGGSSLDGSVECSSTAPISSGNSGGPLLFADDLTVGGLSYATYEGAQNLNLVVPAFRVRQLLAKLDLHGAKTHGWPLVHPAANVGSLSFLPSIPAPHVQVRIPSARLVTARGSPALRALMGCSQGTFVSEVPRSSVFTSAEPPLPPQFFLQSIDGNRIDAYGQGAVPSYVDERVSFAEMLTLRQDLTGNASIVVCADGKTSTHALPLLWQSRFDTELSWHPEVGFARLDFELFAGVGFMELSQNHVDALVKLGYPTLARFNLADFQSCKHVFVSYVAPGCDDYDTIASGMIVAKVNGKPVTSLEDYRRVFVPSSDIFTFETDQHVFFAANFTEQLHKQVAGAGPGAKYLLTAAVKHASHKLGS